ncbi:unnamed protein product [Victoria cruziana]
MGGEGGGDDGRRLPSAEKVLRYSLFSLAAVVCGVGLYTLSLKKMVVVYISGLLLVAGVVLPDWQFFDRNVSQWTSLVTATQPSLPPRSFRFGCHPLRLSLYTIVYGFALYKLWKYVISN